MEPRDLFIRFKGDTSDAEAALNRVDQKLQQTGQTAKTTAENLSKVPEVLGKGDSGNFNQIVSAFEQLQKTTNLSSKDVNAAATAFNNLGKAGFDTKSGLSGMASQLDVLSKAGRISGEEAQKLQTTFTQLSAAGIKSGDDLNKLASTFNALDATQKEVTLSSVATAAALGSVLGNAVVGLATKFAQLLPEMLKAGETATNINDSFVRLEGGSLVAEQALAKLRAATQGLVSDLDIKQTVNQGLLLGLEPGKMDKLAAAATRLGQAVGRDATSALNDLILGLSRGSPRILDNLGIVVKAEEAYKKYAAANHLLVSELTEAEKKVAIQNEAVEQADKKVTELGPPLQNAATEFHRLGTEISNASTDMSIAAANSDTLKVVFHQLTDSVAGLSALFRVLFSDDLDSNIVRAQIRIEQLSEKIKKAKDAANNNVPSGSVGEYLGFLFDFSTVPSPGAGGPTFSNADQQELQKLRAEQARDKSKKQYQTIEADIAAAFREIEAKDRFKAEQDEERRRIKAAADSKKAAKEAENALESLEKKRDAIFAKSQQQEDLLGLQKAINSADGAGIEEFAKKINQSTSDQLYAGLKDTLAKAGLSRESKQFGEILAATINENASKAISNVTQNVAKNQQQVAGQALQYKLEDALKQNNLAAVQDLQTQIENADWENAFKASVKQQLDNNVAVFQAYFLAGKEADSKLAIEHQQNAHRLEELQKQAFQNSVSFFQDLLSSAIDGTGKDLEQTLLEALKKVGIGFASQIGGNLLQNLGLNLGSISSASGLGQSLAAAIGFGGGGINPLTSLFGGGSGPSGIIANAAAGVGGGAATGAATGSSLTATLGSLGPIGGSLLSGGAVIIGTGAGAALLASGIKQGGLGGGAVGGLGGGLIGGSLFGGIGASVLGPLGALAGAFGGDLFGGDSQLAKERKDREELLNKITGGDYKNFSFGVVGNSGISHLDPNTYNIQGANNPLSAGPTGTQGDVTALVSPLAELLTGGNGKLKDDLAGIFASSVGEVKNFNEAIVNTESLMGKLNLNAEDAKTGLFQLFKDGKIALNEFTTGIYDLDVIQQDVFQGPDGIAQGFQIIADQLGNGTNQGLYGAVAALSTEVNTFGKQGLKTTKEIADYFAKAGDTVHSKFFQLLSDQGFKTSDDLKKALDNPDLFIQLLSDLQNAGDLTQGLATSQGDVASSSDSAYGKMVSGAGAAKSAQEKLNSELQKTVDLQKKIGGGGGGSSSDPTGTTLDESDGGGTPASTPNPTGRTRSRIVNPRRPTGL